MYVSMYIYIYIYIYTHICIYTYTHILSCLLEVAAVEFHVHKGSVGVLHEFLQTIMIPIIIMMIIIMMIIIIIIVIILINSDSSINNNHHHHHNRGNGPGVWPVSILRFWISKKRLGARWSHS